MKTRQLYLDNSYVKTVAATVVAVDEFRVALDQTVFYPGGGGQPADRGSLVHDSVISDVIEVTKDAEYVWHLVPDAGLRVGDHVEGRIDWARRYQCMRTHTGMHVLTAVINRTWQVAVTGGNMEPLTARMDFDFDPLPEGFRDVVTGLVNEELQRNREVHVAYVDPAVFGADPELIRTKTNLVPAGLESVRVVEIVGLDRQADGGTHVRRTAEVGGMSVIKVESKGRNNKRLRVRFD